MATSDASEPEPTPQAPDAASARPCSESKLPKLSAADFVVYNRLATKMDAYHNHFRAAWNMLYQACTSGSRPAGLSIHGFTFHGIHLCHSLGLHHGIEEQEIFPVLAARMSEFGPQEHLIQQHEQIHDGLEKLEQYLKRCLKGEQELRLEEMKTILDGFGPVLWAHLDDEVRMLGAENMRRYWTKDEMLDMNW